MATANYAVEALEKLTFKKLQLVAFDIRKLTLNFSYSERNKFKKA